MKLRWVQPRNIHLTLKFLGDVPSEQLSAVASAMRLAVQGRSPLALTVQGLGVFPSIRRPRVLWIGLGGELEALARLQSVLDEALAQAGFGMDQRPFRAHLTLARMPDRVDVQRLQQAMQQYGRFACEGLACDELVLLQSDLRPGGAVYTPLARSALR